MKTEPGQEQSQEGVIRYAGEVIAAGLPPGVLVIDDGWQERYGSFGFRADRFPNPKGMVDELHRMGFRVMLWISPFVSPDGPAYRNLEQKGYLVRRKGSATPAVIEWRSGQSASYDMTNPEAAAHYTAQLRKLQGDCGIDGFRFDGGDDKFYNQANIEGHRKDAISVDHTQAWAGIGLEFPLNEYRACWKMGGQPLVQCLGNEGHSWDAVAAIVPEMVAAGLLGYTFACPVTAGGRDDGRIAVRAAQIHAMMPMMHFAEAPWRELSAENMALVKQAAELHAKMAPYILECAKSAARTGEPIVRHMEYAFPGEGFMDCKDQYMLGDRYMVTPVVDANDHRDVKLPKGRWRDDLGQVYRGGTSISIKVPLGRIPYFEKM